jgi:hypothetical protein
MENWFRKSRLGDRIEPEFAALSLLSRSDSLDGDAMDDWAKGAIGGAVIGIVGALGVVGAALTTGYYGFASKDEELRVHLVELAIGTLRADPKEGVAPARAWAIEVIEKNLGHTTR